MQVRWGREGDESRYPRDAPLATPRTHHDTPCVLDVHPLLSSPGAAEVYPCMSCPPRGKVPSHACASGLGASFLLAFTNHSDAFCQKADVYPHKRTPRDAYVCALSAHTTRTRTRLTDWHNATSFKSPPPGIDRDPRTIFESGLIGL